MWNADGAKEHTREILTLSASSRCRALTQVPSVSLVPSHALLKRLQRLTSLSRSWPHMWNLPLRRVRPSFRPGTTRPDAAKRKCCTFCAKHAHPSGHRPSRSLRSETKLTSESARGPGGQHTLRYYRRPERTPNPGPLVALALPGGPTSRASRRAAPGGEATPRTRSRPSPAPCGPGLPSRAWRTCPRGSAARGAGPAPSSGPSPAAGNPP